MGPGCRDSVATLLWAFFNSHRSSLLSTSLPILISSPRCPTLQAPGRSIPLPGRTRCAPNSAPFLERRCCPGLLVHPPQVMGGLLGLPCLGSHGQSSAAGRRPASRGQHETGCPASQPGGLRRPQPRKWFHPHFRSVDLHCLFFSW